MQSDEKLDPAISILLAIFLSLGLWVLIIGGIWRFCQWMGRVR